MDVERLWLGSDSSATRYRLRNDEQAQRECASGPEMLRCAPAGGTDILGQGISLGSQIDARGGRYGDQTKGNHQVRTGGQGEAHASLEGPAGGTRPASAGVHRAVTRTRRPQRDERR